jgi:Holliday junction resolvase RusA-like endonuclease
MRWNWHGSDASTRWAIDVPVEVEVVIRTKSGNMKPDIDNAAGAYLDALQAAGVIANDCLVRRLVVEVQLGDDDHAVISVREWRQ